MSKFCENCGSELKDTDNVCPNCGAAVEKTTKKDVKKDVKLKNEQEQTVNTNESKKNTKTFAIIGGAAALVVILLVIIIALCSGGYKKPLDYMCKGMQKADSKTFLKAFPAVMTEDLEDSIDNDYLEKQLESFEDEYGKNIKITYKILDKEKIDKEDLEDLQENLEDKYEDSKKKCKVSAGYKLSVKMTIKGKDDKETDTSTINVYKIGGKWCLAGASSLF
ncbi:MAG: zinc ribbon domain-containing protein [Clostridia bacterium]|nr:zinc ribbon domain-containing protein [Clostridia bacterium]